jgi:hypothetical protein
MDTVSFRVHNNLVRDFSVSIVSHSVRFSPSVRRVSAADSVCHFLDVFSKSTVSLDDTVSETPCFLFSRIPDDGTSLKKPVILCYTPSSETFRIYF